MSNDKPTQVGLQSYIVQNGTERNGMEWNGPDRTGTERNGTDRTGTDQTGTERNGRELAIVNLRNRAITKILAIDRTYLGPGSITLIITNTIWNANTDNVTHVSETHVPSISVPCSAMRAP